MLTWVPRIYENFWYHWLEISPWFVENKNKMYMILMLWALFEETLSSDMSPQNICGFFWKCLSLPNTSTRARVLGKRVNRGAEYGLEIAVM